MANSLLTPQQITRRALVILHQKLNFVGNINRQYDDRFAQDGAKIGDTLRIRLPNQYTVRTGAALSAQDTTETNTTLQVNNQKGVDTQFTSVDLTLSLDDFAQRILDPAMSVLASNIEADALTMRKNVWQSVNNIGSPFALRQALLARKRLTDSLAPEDGNRSVVMNTQDNVDLVDAVKGLFQDSKEIAAQYREGKVGRTGGFTYYENTLLSSDTTGTAASTTGYLINGGSQTGATMTVDTGTTTFLVGDIITITGVNEVHPETKADTGRLQQFVVTANSGTSATSLAISPAIVTSGGAQNVTAAPADNAPISKIGGNATLYNASMAFHRDAFAFATADLVLPKGVDMASRAVMDGISMRLVRQYDIQNDRFPVRIDVLYGYKAIRPQLACRILSN